MAKQSTPKIPPEADLEGGTEPDAVHQAEAELDVDRDPPPEPLEAELAELRGQLEAVNAKAAEHWDRVLRLQAELDNQRKRSQRDIEHAHKFALEGFVTELLGVKDSLELGLQAATGEEVELVKIIEGTELTLRLLSQALEKYKVEEVDPQGSKFNPDLHQAIATVESESEANTVISVIQKGYTLAGRLVRPALVQVAK